MEFTWRLYKTALLSFLFALSTGGSLQASGPQVDNKTELSSSSSEVITPKWWYVSKIGLWYEPLLLIVAYIVSLILDGEITEWSSLTWKNLTNKDAAKGTAILFTFGIMILFLLRLIIFCFVQSPPKQGKKKKEISSVV